MVGIMGGTFNPIHYGHLMMCEHIREEFGLKKVLFVPAKSPPHKGGEWVAEAGHRMEMVRMAIRGNPFFEPCDVELRLEGPSYTVETLKILTGEYGAENRLSLILGADSMVQFTTWKRYGEILGMADIIVAKRPDTDSRALDQAIARIRAEHNAVIHLSGASELDLSSTRIRNRVREGLSIKYMVPECVEEYIHEHGLYTGE
ncbi:MAG: nicotinate (nicotinamide) nucleotide adenylyltransferase [Clostridiaceae bacterium]|nr:nicotinate (nicotinamide) nucleotide adenylyltransferase [Clostridiaceae bacterium]